MKKTSLFAAVILSALTASAQTDTAKLIVHYKFSHLRDTTRRDRPYTENMVLLLGQNSSVYKSYDRKLQGALMKKQMDDQVAAQQGQQRMMINVGSRVETTSFEYYQYPAQNKLIDKESLFGTQYLIEQPMPVIKWSMSADTMTIGGLHCQKAGGHFKGRDFIAWFASDMPFRAGPWKLNGLPGLIVEAYDTKKEVVFKFDFIEEASNQAQSEKTTDNNPPPTLAFFGGDENDTNPNVIAPPAKAIHSTQKEFERISEAARKDPSGYMKSMAGSSGLHFSAAPAGAPAPAPAGGPGVKTISIMGGGPKTVINNPIELPEKP